MAEKANRNSSSAMSQQEKSTNTVIRSLSLTLLFLLFCAIAIYTTDYISNPKSSIVVKKDNIKSQISTIVRNGGDLAAIKHVYDTRSREKISFLPFRKDLNKFYQYDVTLSTVLNDIRCDYLTSVPFEKDSLYYEQLLFIIRENDYRNPFEGLEANQRYYFESIRIKSRDYFSSIQSDVSKIADELYNKNLLVEKYLNKSTLSFYISIFAVFITVIMSIIQIRSNSKGEKGGDELSVNKKQDHE